MMIEVSRRAASRQTRGEPQHAEINARGSDVARRSKQSSFFRSVAVSRAM